MLTSAPVDMLLQEAVSPRLRKQRGLEVGADGADGAGGAHEGDGGDDRHGGGSGGSREVRRSASLAVQVRVQTSGAALECGTTVLAAVQYVTCGAAQFGTGKAVQHWQCRVAQCSAVQAQQCGTAVQCSAVQCSTTVQSSSEVQCSAAGVQHWQVRLTQCGAARCSTVQHSAAQCRGLQAAVRGSLVPAGRYNTVRSG